MSKNEKASDIVAELKAKAEVEPVARLLQTKLVELTPGYAKVTMKLRPEFLNFNGLIFGSIIAALADQAFAYASNSLAYPSFASQTNIYFIAGAEVGDELTGECRVIKSGKRVGISEMTVTDQKGKLIAKATGMTIPVPEYRIRRTV